MHGSNLVSHLAGVAARVVLTRPPGLEQHVGALEVTVHDADAVQVGHAGCDVARTKEDRHLRAPGMRLFMAASKCYFGIDRDAGTFDCKKNVLPF